jgi:hypothetical protein
MATVVKDFRVKAGLVVEGSTATVNSHDILTEALVDAKGDLLVASGADAVTRLAVGTNNYVLTADDSATNGVKWAAPAAVGVFGESISFEGATANDYETTLAVTDPTADRTITFPDATGTVALTSDITVSASSTNTFSNKSISLATNTVSGTLAEFNTALSDADFATIAGSETLTNKTLTTPVISSITNGAATLTLPTSTGTVALTSDIPSLSGYVTESGTQTLTNKTITGPVVSGLTLSDSSIVIEGSTANNFETTLTVTDPTADRTITFKDADGTVAFTTDVDTRLALAGGTMTGAIAMGTNKITGLGTPTDATDAATKSYVDSAAQGIDWKASVRAATTENIDLVNAPGTIDGVTLTNLDRVLVKNQSTASQNGIYRFVTELGNTLARAADADEGAELTASLAVFVEEGTVNADQGYTLTNNGAITIGTTALTFTQFTGLGQIVAGDGLSKTGNTLNVTAGTGISIVSDTVTNDGVLSITGTTNQISATASTGAITLSTPQDIHSTATPTFTGVTVGSVTLTDALLGTATGTAGVTATTIDTWSASTYSSAKYIVQMKKGTDIEVIELLVTVDGSNNVYLTEYADVISNAQLGTTDAVYSSGNVLLQVTGAAADTVVKVNKVYIEA